MSEQRISFESWQIEKICDEFEKHGRAVQLEGTPQPIAARVIAIINKLAEENRQLKDTLAMHERGGPQGTIG